MKSLCLSLILLSSSAFGADFSLETQHPAGQTKVTVYYKVDSKLGTKLFQVLKGSELFQEVLGGGYIAPGTMYVSKTPGITITKGNSSIQLDILMTKEHQGNVFAGGRHVTVSYGEKSSPAGVLHEALLKSRSAHVITQEKPTEIIRPSGDTATVLSERAYYGEFLTCGGMIANGLGRCELSLGN